MICCGRCRRKLCSTADSHKHEAADSSFRHCPGGQHPFLLAHRTTSRDLFNYLMIPYERRPILNTTVSFLIHLIRTTVFASCEKRRLIINKPRELQEMVLAVASVFVWTFGRTSYDCFSNCIADEPHVAVNDPRKLRNIDSRCTRKTHFVPLYQLCA